MKTKFLTQSIEVGLLNKGFDFIVGIDEVGRGAWAGPLYLCAYAFSNSNSFLEGINDSKMLSKLAREALYPKLSLNKHFLKILDNKEIDKQGLGKAMNLGLAELIKEVEVDLGKNILFIVDGYFKGEWDSNVKFEKKADSNYYSVACASIIAKVMRDNLMNQLAISYPHYFLDTNVGYGTTKHREAIKEHGTCEIHRRSYKPLKQSTMKN